MVCLRFSILYKFYFLKKIIRFFFLIVVFRDVIFVCRSIGSSFYIVLKIFLLFFENVI